MTIGTLLLLPLAVANPPRFAPAAPACTSAGCPAPTPTPPGGGPWAVPLAPNCPPSGPPAPVLMAKLTPPGGGRVTLFPGTPTARMFAEAVTVGLRPGYVYRVELTGLPGRPDEALYPEIEVYGSLIPRAGMNYAEYPVGVAFSATDVEKAATGTFVTKVFYLENPVTAVPVAATVDRPTEDVVESAEVAVKAALERGRPVLVVRLGNRKPDAEALRLSSVPGTVLLPGETHLPPPGGPPVIGFAGVPLYDPILGPKIPDEECLTDGGDRDTRLGIGPDGRLRGLDSSDVSAEYTVGGKRKVTTSNRVCVCVPRFAATRADANPGGVNLAVGAGEAVQAFGPKGLGSRHAPASVDLREKPVAVEGRVRAMAAVANVGVHILVGTVRPSAFGQAEGVQVLANAVAPDEVTNANEFVVTKSIDPAANVKLGDEVTITIKYANHTRRPIADVVVSDSLTPRLEYVFGSSESDRAATTTTDALDGNTVVRFDIPGVLQPGQSGVVKFKVRVR